jgi:hypothetical protein
MEVNEVDAVGVEDHEILVGTTWKGASFPPMTNLKL